MKEMVLGDKVSGYPTYSLSCETRIDYILSFQLQESRSVNDS